MAFDRDKFKRVIHYVIWSTNDAAKLGATKLNKILWFSDARAFVMHGAPITGEEYVRRQHGPMSRHFYEAMRELEQEGAIAHRRDRLYDFDHDVYLSRRDPDISQLSADERKVIDYFRKYVTEQHTAQSISEESHDFGWEIAKMGETLPYFAILAERGRDPEGAELEWAKGVAKRRKMP